VTRGDWGLGENWRLEKMGINIKRYPMCYATHRSIDAMLDLAAENDLTPDAIDEIHVRIGNAQDLMLRNREPKTALEAKFSIEFAMASALIARKVGLKELDDGFVRRDDIVEVMRKVKRSTTDERLADMPPFSPDDRVSIRLKNGKTLAHEPVVRAKGHWQKPLTETELREKFLDCTEGKLGRKQAEALFEQLNNLEEVKSLRELPVVKLSPRRVRSNSPAIATSSAPIPIITTIGNRAVITSFAHAFATSAGSSIRTDDCVSAPRRTIAARLPRFWHPAQSSTTTHCDACTMSSAIS
jgi:hypothetical protein